MSKRVLKPVEKALFIIPILAVVALFFIRSRSLSPEDIDDIRETILRSLLSQYPDEGVYFLKRESEFELTDEFMQRFADFGDKVQKYSKLRHVLLEPALSRRFQDKVTGARGRVYAAYNIKRSNWFIGNEVTAEGHYSGSVAHDYIIERDGSRWLVKSATPQYIE